MRLLIWGAGAIGGTIGAYLARAGHDVTMVDMVEEHVATINRSGLRITGPIAELTARPAAFTPGTLSGRWDTIMLATKAHHTEAAAQALLPHLSSGGCVISVQNGLNEIAIAAVAGAQRTVGAFVNFGADYLEPGVIHYGGRGAVVVGRLLKQSTVDLAFGEAILDRRIKFHRGDFRVRQPCMDLRQFQLQLVIARRFERQCLGDIERAPKGRQRLQSAIVLKQQGADVRVRVGDFLPPI